MGLTDNLKIPISNQEWSVKRLTSYEGEGKVESVECFDYIPRYSNIFRMKKSVRLTTYLRKDREQIRKFLVKRTDLKL